MIRKFALWLVLSTVVNSSLAATLSDRIALVVGNGDYEFSPLANAVNDAKDMAVVLGDLGFTVDLVLDGTEQDMLNAIKRFGKKLKPDSVGLFYYAGHAVQSSGLNYLIPLDAGIDTETDLEYEAIAANRILDYMGDASNSMNIIVLDACRNNPFRSQFRSTTRGLAKMSGPRGSLIAYSTSPGDVAMDGEGRNSPYTKNLLRLIRDPMVPLELLFRKVRVAVKNDTSGLQVPWESSSITDDFYFNNSETQSVDKSSVPISEDESAWTQVKDSQDTGDFEDFIERFPGSAWIGFAKTKIKLISLEQMATAKQSEIELLKNKMKSFEENANNPSVEEIIGSDSQSDGPKNPTNSESGSDTSELTIVKSSVIENRLIMGRYSIRGNIVTDESTGLQWLRCSMGQVWTGEICDGRALRYKFNDAKSVVRKMKSGGSADYGAWRLPKPKELTSLVFCSSNQPKEWNSSGTRCVGNFRSPAINSEAFPNTDDSARYWTISTTGSSQERRTVNFYNGAIEPTYQYSENFVRPVRAKVIRRVDSSLRN